MRKFSVGVAIFLSVLMMAGSVFALNASDHVKVAPNGKGDLIIFPWFFAYSGGYESKLTVINTSATDCVVAKVVYRSYVFSQELLDHLIFLSPNDVWTGTIKIAADGKNAMIFSDDDSILVADGVFATKTNPVQKTFITPSCASDANNNGYVEVIEAASADYAVVSTATPKYPVPKLDIYKWYAGVKDADVKNIYPPKNVLAAYQENRNGVGNAVKQAVVLADYFNQKRLSTIDTSYLGELSNNTLAEIEAAIAKASVNLPYKVSKDGEMVVHTFSFPTKISEQYSTQIAKCAYIGNPRSPYWTNLIYQGTPYKKNIYDLSEHSPETGGISPIFSPIPPVAGDPQMSEEVTRLFIMYNTTLDAFTEGWVRYTWTNNDTVAKSGFTKSNTAITFTGTPVLPSVLYQGADGNWTEAGASYTDGTVTVGGISVPYYQYK